MCSSTDGREVGGRNTLSLTGDTDNVAGNILTLMQRIFLSLCLVELSCLIHSTDVMPPEIMFALHISANIGYAEAFACDTLETYASSWCRFNLIVVTTCCVRSGQV